MRPQAFRPLVFALALQVVLFCLSAAASGADLEIESELDRFLNKIDKKASQVESFQCQFKQEKHLEIFARPVVFEGMLSVSRPDRLRWEFTKPLPSVLIFNGKKGIRCSGSSEPVYFDLAADPVMRAVAQQLWGWLGGRYLKLKDQYHMQLDGEDVLRLTPRDEGVAGFVKEIVVVFDPVSLQASQTVIHEPGGDRTILFFQEYRINQPQPASLFASCMDGES